MSQNSFIELSKGDELIEEEDSLLKEDALLREEDELLKKKDELLEDAKIGCFQLSKRKLLTVITLFGCFCGYMVIILNFKSLSVSLPDIIKEGYVNIVGGSQILASGNLACLVGKVILGLVADKIGGRKLLLSCFFIIAISSIAFGFSTDIVGFIICWSLLRFGHAGAWPSISKFIGSWFEKKHWGKVWSGIGFSSRSSSALSSVIGGFVISFFSWSWLFWFSGSIAIVILILNGFLLRDSPAYWGLLPKNFHPYDPDESNYYEEPINHQLDNATFKEVIVTIAKSLMCWLIFLSMFFTAMLIEFGSFAPLYIKENFGLTSGEAGSASSIFPAGSAIVVVISGFIYDRLQENGWGHGILIVGFLVVSICASGAMWGLFHLNLSWPYNLVAGLISIFIFGGAIAPAFYIPMSIFAVKFGGKHCGILIGIIDAFGYAGSLIFNLVSGEILEAFGWEPFLIMLVVASGLAGLFYSCFFVLDYKQAHQLRRNLL